MSYESERNVIGALLIDTKALDKIPFLEPQMFTDATFGEIFVAMLKIREARLDATLETVIAEMQTGTAQDDFTQSRIVECAREVFTAQGIESSARLIWNEYRAKRLGEVVNRIRGDPRTVDEEISTLLDELPKLQNMDDSVSKDLSQITEENMDKYFKETERPRVDLGLHALDDLLGGLEGGDLIIIGARPAVGKSAFASQITLHFADIGKKVGYFNLEMQEKQVYERFVSSKSGIPITRIRRATRYLDADEERRFHDANTYLLQRKEVVVTTGSKKVSEIRNDCIKQKYDVIIIDYLQLLKSDRSYGSNRYAEVGAISHGVKAIAMEMNIPVIGLCQLNRSSEGREDREPTMGELRESGDFEQDASVILLLWNSDKNDHSQKMIKVEKQRQGKTGKIALYFDGDHMRFAEVSTRNAPSTAVEGADGFMTLPQEEKPDVLFD